MIHHSWFDLSLIVRKLVETALAVMLLAALAGCGGDSSDAPIDDLARYLPAGDPGYLAYADLAEVREELGLPAHANALDFQILLGGQTDPATPEGRPGGPGAALALVEPADEPVASATAGLEATCVTGFGGWEDAPGNSGTLRLAIDGTADAEDVDVAGIRRLTGTDLGEPSVDGSEVEIPFTGGGAEQGNDPLRDLNVAFGPELYDCG